VDRSVILLIDWSHNLDLVSKTVGVMVTLARVTSTGILLTSFHLLAVVAFNTTTPLDGHFAVEEQLGAPVPLLVAEEYEPPADKGNPDGTGGAGTRCIL
jgi:hypothetical protein